MPGLRKLGVRAIDDISQSGYHLSDPQSGFRAYTSKAIKSLILVEDGKGPSTDILGKSRAKGLTIAEVPITVVPGVEASTQNPVSHGVDSSLNALNRLSIHHPLLFYGVPGGVSIIISLVFWAITFNSFRLYNTISTNVLLIAICTTLVGLLLVITAMILWVITSLRTQ